MSVPDRAEHPFRKVDPRVLAEAFLRSKGMSGDDAVVGDNVSGKTTGGYSAPKLQERAARRRGSSPDTFASFMALAPGVESASDLEHIENQHHKKVLANRPRVEAGDTDSNVVGGPISLGDTDVRTAGERDPRRRREPKPQRQATPEELERRRRRGPASATTPKRKKTRGPVGERPLPGATSDERTAGKHGFTVI